MKTTNDVIAFIKKAIDLNFEITKYLSFFSEYTGIKISNNSHDIYIMYIYNSKTIIIKTKYTDIEINATEKEMLQFKSLMLDVKDYIHDEALNEVNNFFSRDNIDK